MLSSTGIVFKRMPRFSASLYHTMGSGSSQPVRIPLTRAKGTKPTAVAAALSGTYTDQVYGEAKIHEVNAEPVLSFTHAAELFTGKLEHWQYDTWKWNHNDPFLESGYVTFSFDTDHKVTGFKIDLNSPDFHFWKLDFLKNK